MIIMNTTDNNNDIITNLTLLMEMGFTKQHSIEALQLCEYNILRTINYLTQLNNSCPSPSAPEFRSTFISSTSIPTSTSTSTSAPIPSSIPTSIPASIPTSTLSSPLPSQYPPYASLLTSGSSPSRSPVTDTTTIPTTPSSSSSFSPIYRGRVSIIHLSRGYGFILPSQNIPNYGNEAIFFHFSKVVDNQYLQVDDEVYFTVTLNDRSSKLCAIDVTVTRFIDDSMRGKKWPSRDSLSNSTNSRLIPASNSSSSSSSSSTMAISSPHSYSRYAPQDSYRYGQIVHIDNSGNVGRIAVSPSCISSIEDGGHSVPSRVMILLFDNRAISPILPVHTFVSFTTQHDPTVGLIAVNIRSLSEASIVTASPSQLQLRNVCNHQEPLLIHNEIMKSDETRLTEFKSLARSSAPESSFLPIVDKYATAFRNARNEGGWIYAGVEDDGRITGLSLNRAIRDVFRRGVDSVMQALTPSVAPEWYRLYFIPIHECLYDPNHPSSTVIDASSFMESTTLLMTIPDLFVVVLHILPPPINSPIQMTSGRYSHNNIGGKQAYIRRDGSVRLMEAEMILSRERELHGSNQQKVVDEVLARLKAESNTPTSSQPSSILPSTNQQLNFNPNVNTTESQESMLSKELELAEKVIDMDFPRDQVLNAIFQLQQNRKKAIGVKKPIDCNQILDILRNNQNSSSSSTSNNPHLIPHGYENAHQSFQFSRDTILAPLQTHNVSRMYPDVQPKVQNENHYGPGMIVDGIPCTYCKELCHPSFLLNHQQSCSYR